MESQRIMRVWNVTEQMGFLCLSVRHLAIICKESVEELILNTWDVCNMLFICFWI
jgi:hypothetical protein